MRIIYTDKAPKPVGPYSQAVVWANVVYVAGQIPIDPSTGRVVGDTIEEQARQALENLKAILEAAGSSLDRVLKVTVYIRDIGFFDRFNKVYSEYFKEHRPARSVVEVSNLPKGVMVEIEAIAAAEEE